MATYLIGLDVGTSSAKAVLIDETGEVVSTVAPTYEFQTPRPLWAESDPEDWWQGSIQAIRSLVDKVGAEQVAGIGLTGQMHGLVMLDAEGEILRPCIMWNDQRTGAQCEAITEKVGSERVLQLTGNPILPGFTAPKIAWVRENEPEVFDRVDKVLLPKDYVRYRLTGDFFTDVSDASGTSLLDVANRGWSDEMISALEIPSSWLPEVTESTVASTKISKDGAAATGLLEGTPVIAGGGDQAAQAVGCGIVKEGVVSTTVGTSGVVFAHSDEYRVDPEGRLHAFCHAVPGRWHLMGVMLSAAGSFQWYRNQLGQAEMAAEAAGGSDAYDALTQLAAKAPPGAEGLLFLPYLSGERTPYPDPSARGSFVGLTLRHGKSHLTRAVLEGVSYGLNDSLSLMRRLGIEPDRVILSGGGARSPFWRQMLADVFSARCELVNATEGAAYGAALLAAVGAGVYEDVETACETCIRVTNQTEVSSDKEIYADYYPRYRALYPALRKEFSALAELSEKYAD
jgi:xylulokinase